MLIEIRESDGSLLTSFEMSDNRLDTNPILLRIDVKREDGKQARGFVSAKLTKQGCRFEVTGIRNTSEMNGRATATFKVM